MGKDGEMKRLSVIFCVWFLFLFAGHYVLAFGATYYVDPEGSGSNPGTQKKPWRSIQKAANIAKAGDTVLVNNGVYNGFYTVNSGTSSNPIVFKANGDKVIINSRNARTPDNINVEGTDYIIIDGFIVQNSPRGGIRVAESWGVVVKNNTVGPCGLWCIFTGFAPQVQILNNKAFGSTREIALYVSNSRTANDNPVVRGNEVYGSASSGIQVNGDCFSGGDGVIRGAIIENNIVHDNNAKGFSLISMTDSVVQNNLIYNNGTGNRGAGGIHFSDQVSPRPCGRPSNNNVVVNNTIIEPRIAGIRITDAAKNNIIFNNLIISNTPIADEVGNSSIDAASNLTMRYPIGLFVDPSAGNYHLLSNSPAIDAGLESYLSRNAPPIDIEGKSRPSGKAFDIGAYEYNFNIAGEKGSSK